VEAGARRSMTFRGSEPVRLLARTDTVELHFPPASLANLIVTPPSSWPALCRPSTDCFYGPTR
jgi:hypothetical protein